MSKQFPTGIEPIDASFKALNEIGIPLPSVIAIAQEDFDDASRFILMDLIDNYIRNDFFCIYILFNKKENNLDEHYKKRENRKYLMKFVDILDNNASLKDAFIKVMDAEEAIKKGNLFSWNKIPGSDSGRLIYFLKNEYNIDWVRTSKIKKSNDDNTIEVFDEENHLSLCLNDEKNKVNLKIDDGRTDKFTVSGNVNSKLNIHKKGIIPFEKYNSNELKLIKFSNVKKFIEKDYKELSYECRLKNKNKIIIFDNSSWILESAIKEEDLDFFELCKHFDDSSIVFHFFTLNIHDQKNKAKIGDLVDGYIDLKSLKENKSRPLRSVGIKKMRTVRVSSDYNAYKVDDYGIVKAFK